MSGQLIQTYWREIVAIIESGLKPDPHRVSSFADHLAQRLESDGETKLADKIRRLTTRAAKPSGATFVPQAMASDIEANQPLFEEIAPVPYPRYPVLSPTVESELNRFVELNRMSGELSSIGVEPPCTLLLYGPPGCGKTMSAVAVASSLGLPTMVVRLDSLLGSFLGNSAKNLRRVFDSALSRPCVLLLDEFDAIAKMRDDAQEVGEVKRLVGSLLQNFDRLGDRQIVVAATNHHHVLDPAIWRRFDVALSVDIPTRAQISGIMTSVIPEGSLSVSSLDAFGVMAYGMSGSDVSSTVRRALQDSLLVPDEPFEKLIALAMLKKLGGQVEPYNHLMSKKSVVISIRKLTGDNLTLKQIAKLADCNYAYAREIINSWESNKDDDR